MADKNKSLALVPTAEQFSLTPRTLDEAMKYADMIAKSSLVPPQYKDKPGDVLVAIQYGYEIGVKPLQALQNIAVINGKPTVYGDLALAVVQASAAYEWHKEYEEPNGTAVFEAKRRGNPNVIRATFSDEDAKNAGLLDKSGPWKQYRKRMKQMRARAFGLRDGFSDALKGLAIREEVEDYVPVPGTDPGTTIAPPKAKALEVKPEVNPETEAKGGFVIEKVTSSSRDGSPKFIVYFADLKAYTRDAELAKAAKEWGESKTTVERTTEKDGEELRLVELAPFKEAVAA